MSLPSAAIVVIGLLLMFNPAYAGPLPAVALLPPVQAIVDAGVVDPNVWEAHTAFNHLKAVGKAMRVNELKSMVSFSVTNSPQSTVMTWDKDLVQPASGPQPQAVLQEAVGPQLLQQPCHGKPLDWLCGNRPAAL